MFECLTALISPVPCSILLQLQSSLVSHLAVSDCPLAPARSLSARHLPLSSSVTAAPSWSAVYSSQLPLRDNTRLISLLIPSCSCTFSQATIRQLTCVPAHPLCLPPGLRSGRTFCLAHLAVSWCLVPSLCSQSSPFDGPSYLPYLGLLSSKLRLLLPLQHPHLVLSAADCPRRSADLSHSCLFSLLSLLSLLSLFTPALPFTGCSLPGATPTRQLIRALFALSRFPLLASAPSRRSWYTDRCHFCIATNHHLTPHSFSSFCCFAVPDFLSARHLLLLLPTAPTLRFLLLRLSACPFVLSCRLPTKHTSP